ncbi:MAG: hypothetical protein KDA92_12925, partial [Planctomycetales bacterium]|nr:hypothetical protein [Planctomycetales bacterium]
MYRTLILLLIVGSIVLPSAGATETDFRRDVQPLLTKYCAGCHNEDDREGELSLVDFTSLMQGGEHGAVVVLGESAESSLWKVLQPDAELRMPPEGNPAPPPDQIQHVKRWIDAGANDSADAVVAEEPYVIDSELASLAPKPTTALAVRENWLAVGRFGAVDLLTSDRQFIRRFELGSAKVHAIAFSHQQDRMLVVGGMPGKTGDIWHVELATGKVTPWANSHHDAIYAVAINRDETRVATAGYDRKIIVWDLAAAKPLRTLEGHNGPVFDLAFAPNAVDRHVLASASGDATVKIWDAETGQRLDTMSQPLLEQYSVAISPDGKLVAAAGADNRIRLWQLESTKSPQINPLLIARYAHEQPIQRIRFANQGRELVSSSSDRTIKSWDVTGLRLLQTQTLRGEAAQVLAVDETTRRVHVGRMDGGLETIALSDVEKSTSVAAEANQADGPIVDASAATVTAVEVEPNDELSTAMRLTLPFQVTGTIHRGDAAAGASLTDQDLYAFTARAGETWIFTVDAARAGSSLDSRLRILDDQGRSVPRILLRAVRDSYFTFRGKDSVQTGDFRLHNWEEMQLNQLLYANGEVVKFYHYPRGPDSGFNVYPNYGQRHAFFETTPTTHALQEPCYIVEPFPPGTPLPENGLPVFVVNYENDDESLRRWGTDSYLTFTAPADGEYFVVVEDARNLSGEQFTYTLHARAPQPSFSAKLTTKNTKLLQPGDTNAFAGVSYEVEVERNDGFDGPIAIEYANVPEQLSIMSPLIIESGQLRTKAAIHLRSDASVNEGQELGTISLDAVAQINGQTVRQHVGELGPITVGPKAAIGIQFIGNADEGETLEIVAGESAV